MRRIWRTCNPIGAGRLVFTPSRVDRVQDPVVKRIQILRSVVGFAAVIWLMSSYQLVSDAQGLVDDRLEQVQWTINLMAVTCPIAVGGFVAAARPPYRQLYLRRAVKPLGALVALPCAIVFVIVASGWFTGAPIESPSAGAYGRLVGLLFILLWVTPFTLYGIAMSVVHVFRTADIHEMVPPLLVTVLVWEMAAFDVVTGTYDGTPFAVRAVLILGAPLSVTAMTMWEFRRLRTRHAITLRRSLLR
jgi:hypothetical protein